MAKIIAINGNEVKVGEDNGQVTTVPAIAVQYSGAKVGDVVDFYRDGENYIVTLKNVQANAVDNPNGELSSTPITPFGYIGYEVLYAIPIVGFIMVLVNLVSAKNINLKNFSLSYIFVYVIAVIFGIIFGSAIIAAMGNIF